MKTKTKARWIRIQLPWGRPNPATTGVIVVVSITVIEQWIKVVMLIRININFSPFSFIIFVGVPHVYSGPVCAHGEHLITRRKSLTWAFANQHWQFLAPLGFCKPLHCHYSDFRKKFMKVMNLWLKRQPIIPENFKFWRIMCYFSSVNALH